MLDTGTARILAITNPASLGFTTIAWLGIAVAPRADLERAVELIAALPSITYVAICAGRFEILAEVICVSMQDLLAVLDQQVRRLDEVARVETFVSLDLRYKRLSARRVRLPPGLGAVSGT
jgi:DNA-binding Lrp family transcriptional regulator